MRSRLLTEIGISEDALALAKELIDIARRAREARDIDDLCRARFSAVIRDHLSRGIHPYTVIALILDTQHGLYQARQNSGNFVGGALQPHVHHIDLNLDRMMILTLAELLLREDGASEFQEVTGVIDRHRGLSPNYWPIGTLDSTRMLVNAVLERLTARTTSPASS